MCILCDNLELTWNKVIKSSCSEFEQEKEFDNLCFIHQDIAAMSLENKK